MIPIILGSLPAILFISLNWLLYKNKTSPIWPLRKNKIIPRTPPNSLLEVEDLDVYSMYTTEGESE